MSKQGQRAFSVIVFRERSYEVSLEAQNDKMIVQVQDETTTDQWRGSFDARHIEELTRKTGNFKQFRVFINMLESAIKKTSDCVLLELLTYSDLESLRQRKSKGHGLSRGGASDSSCATPSKRYLILTYLAEFDRIHYPLALPYIGKSDPILLQEIIRKLKRELEIYKQKAAYKHHQQHKTVSNTSKLQRKYEALLRDKEELETAYEALQEEMEELLREGTGGEGRQNELTSNKDTRTLKKIIKNMEEDMLKEKTKYQRSLVKKTDEIKTLVVELEELRSTERLLNTKVKSLTNEIALLKRNSLVRGRTNSGSSTNSNRRSVPTSTFSKRYRSSSAEGRINYNTSGNGLGRRERHQQGVAFLRSHTPSPKGKTFQRFDPTSYVLNKRKQQEEAERRLGRTRSRSSSAERNHLPPRPSPLPSRRINISKSRSRGSSAGSQSGMSTCSSSDDEVLLSGNQYSNKSKQNMKRTGAHKRLTRQPKYTPVSANNTSTPRNRSSRRDRYDDSSVIDNSMEIQEIDARLSALQQFMKKSLETVRNTRSCP